MSETKMTVKDVEVVREGTKIILPVIKGKPMSYDEGIAWLKRKKTEEETDVGIHHELYFSPLDAAVAFQRAISEKYGFAGLEPTPTFWGPKPPTMITVPIGPNEKVQVPWGRIVIPGIEGYLETRFLPEPIPRFVIVGVVKQKSAADVKELVDLTEKHLRENSIYKSKAIKISFDWTRNPDGFNPSTDCPKFMYLQNVKEDDLIFCQDVQNALNIGLFAPIEHAESCRQYKVPLKRGILFYGPYGVGKTLAANVTAIKAMRNGFTFIYLENVKDLKRGLEFAAQYAPAVLFAEDVDRVVTGERSISMDEILNTLDGVDTKGGEIITVFTTNHVEDINPALLRMGRLDTLIEIKEPDAEAAVRLVKLYGRGLFASNVDFTKVGEALKGNIPAFIRETTERAKIAAIYRRKGGEIEGHVTEEDLLAAASAMKMHADMLKEKPKEDKNMPEGFFARFPSQAEAKKVLNNLNNNHLVGK